MFSTSASSSISRVVDVADDDRQLVEPGLDGGVVAALAGDDLVARAALPDHERLDDALSR